MKIRNGFVSNSSSSSFVINVADLSPNQLAQIFANDYRDQTWQEPWALSIENGVLTGETCMDNYSMAEFLEKIGG